MNRTSWTIVIVTFVVIAAIGFFFIWPEVSSTWKVYRDEVQAKKDLTDVSKRKEVLTALSKTNQLASLYDIASKYIPQEASSGDLIIQLTAMANDAKLTVDQISLDSEKKQQPTTQEESTTGGKTNTGTQSAPSSPSPSTANPEAKEVDFTMKISGTFPDFMNFLKSTETSSRLISINSMTLNQGQDKFTVELKGKAYWKKDVNLEKNLANVEISEEVINKFQNLKTYGSPINLPAEQGFGRPDPFAGF